MKVTKKDINKIIFDQLELLGHLMEVRNKDDLGDLNIEYRYSSREMDISSSTMYPLRISKPLDYNNGRRDKRTVEMLSEFCLEHELKRKKICAGEGK